MAQGACNAVALSSLQDSGSTDSWSKYDVFLGNFDKSGPSSAQEVIQIMSPRPWTDPAHLRITTSLLLALYISDEHIGIVSLSMRVSPDARLKRWLSVAY